MIMLLSLNYNKHNLLVLFSMFLLLGCSCTPTPIPEVEGIKPIWATRLPGNAGIYDDGLIGLPIYNGKIMFHSTYSTNLENEDNRVHALDMETGKIDWTYPTKQQKDKALFFGGVPFQNNEYIITKMRKYGSVLTDKLICLNLETEQEVWFKEIPESQSYNTNNDVIGEGSDFYYFQQSDKNATLCKGDMLSGVTSSILQIQSEDGYNYNEVTSNLVYHTNKKLIIAGAWERNTNNSDFYSYKNYLYLIDVNKNTLKRKIFSDSIDKEMLIAHIYLVEDKIYAACGLTTICYNLNTQGLDWTYKSKEAYNYMTNRIVVNDGVVFLYGDNRFVGLDANTGEKLYHGDIQCGNANAFNGYVYIVARDARLYILDIKTGKKLHRITCPERALPNPKWGGGFFTACKPQVYGDKLYVFSCTSAYCYDAVPKEE